MPRSQWPRSPSLLVLIYGPASSLSLGLPREAECQAPPRPRTSEPYLTSPPGGWNAYYSLRSGLNGKADSLSSVTTRPRTGAPGLVIRGLSGHHCPPSAPLSSSQSSGCAAFPGFPPLCTNVLQLEDRALTLVRLSKRDKDLPSLPLAGFPSLLLADRAVHLFLSWSQAKGWDGMCARLLSAKRQRWRSWCSEGDTRVLWSFHISSSASPCS